MKTWQQINFGRVRFIRYAEHVLRRELAIIRVDYAKKVSAVGDIAINEISESNIRERIEQVYIDFYIVTGVAFAKSEIDVIKSNNKGLRTKVDSSVLESQWAQRMAQFAKTRCAIRISDVTRHIFKGIESVTKEVFQEVAIQGWGADRAAKEILSRMQVQDTYRAMRIARTEIVSASNEGSFMGAGSFGIEVKKVWIPTLDGKQREEHEMMGSREPIALSEKFRVPIPRDGGEDEMDYPGDPNGSMSNTIQCRCGVSYEPVNSLIDELLNET